MGIVIKRENRKDISELKKLITEAKNIIKSREKKTATEKKNTK